MKKLLIDTDGGVDDALAILAAHGAPDAELVALTTVAGNVSCAQATANVALTRQMHEPSSAVPISPGGTPPGWHPRDPARHGRDGLGGIGELRHADGRARYVWPVPEIAPLPAAGQMRAQCRRHGRALTVVCIGPLTNLAEAVRDSGARALNGARVVILGGHFRTGPSGAVRGDFNVTADPGAVRGVLHAGVRPDFVPLEVCESHVLTPAFLEDMARRHPSQKADFLCDIHRLYMDHSRREFLKSVDGCFPHDAVAVGCAVRPDLFTFEACHVAVTDEADASGRRTHIDPGTRPNARRATGFDSAAFEAYLEGWVWG